MYLNICLTISIKTILYLEFTFIDVYMLYSASIMHLFVYIPTYVTWFWCQYTHTDTPLDTLPFSLLSACSSTAVIWFINSQLPMYVFSDYILLFWGFFVSLTFFTFQLLHVGSLSLSCSNFDFSRLFFLPYLYFMHTKVVQRSI